jgi:hypothetical protein
MMTGYKKIAFEMAEFVCRYTGACPADLMMQDDSFVIDCENVCGQEGRKSDLPVQCWIDFFKFKDKENEQRCV